jgi:tripartite-type tricarboxylate transporter receptor subunit TctC
LLGSKSPYHSVSELTKSDKPVIWAGSGKIDGNADFSAILVHALDIRSKIITGYRGTAEMNLAIQRGEVDGRVVSEESAALYGPGSGMRVLTTLARKRAEQFPDSPTIFEAAGIGTARARLIDWRAGIADLGRLMLVTPATPPDRVELLRTVFAEVLGDPAFIAEIKRLKLSASYASADAVRAAVEQAMTTLDAAALAELRDIALNRYYH